MCMYVCTYVRMYVYVCVYVCMYVCTMHAEQRNLALGMRNCLHRGQCGIFKPLALHGK